MSILQNIKDKLFSPRQEKPVDTSFVFPYSSDKEIKRHQVWDNLQKGILFEDNLFFLPWQTPFADLDTYAEQRKEGSDRVNWFLGEHKILDGFDSFVGVVKGVWTLHKNPFSEIEDFLGFNNEGNIKFQILKNKLTDLLGKPTKVSDMEKFGDFELGFIEWVNGEVRISLSGIEQFACMYRLRVGLTNPKYL